MLFEIVEVGFFRNVSEGRFGRGRDIGVDILVMFRFRERVF